MVSDEEQFLLYVVIGSTLLFCWYLIEKTCRNIQPPNRPQEATLTPNLQASRASGYHHVIEILPEHNRGLNKDILKSIPTFAYDTSVATDPQMQCAVCLSLFKDKDSCRELPVCKHLFHVECIDMWFCSHSNCPLCRANVQAPAEPVRVQPVLVEPIIRDSG